MTTKTLTITEFLLARISEDEAAVQGWIDVAGGQSVGHHYAVAEGHVETYWRLYPLRYRAECEAKRRIIAAAGPTSDWESEYAQGIDFAMRALASVYSDHLDYRDEWRP